MKTHEFTMILTGTPSESKVDRFYGICNDGTLAISAGVAQVHFHRAANSLEEALRSALADAHAAKRQRHEHAFHLAGISRQFAATDATGNIAAHFRQQRKTAGRAVNRSQRDEFDVERLMLQYGFDEPGIAGMFLAKPGTIFCDEFTESGIVRNASGLGDGGR